MTTYTVRWLDYTRPEPICTETFDSFDEVVGFVRSRNRWAALAAETIEWLGYTATHIEHESAMHEVFTFGTEAQS